MATSFLTPTPASPELAQIVNHAIVTSYQSGRAEEADKAARAFAKQQTEFVQTNENLRKQAQLHQDAAKALLDEKAKSVKATADAIAARINDNSVLIQNAPAQGRDPKSVERIAFDVRRDQQRLAEIYSGFQADPIGFQLPNIASDMTALPGDYAATTPEFQAKQTAQSNKAQTEAVSGAQQLQSDTLFASQHGGLLPNAVNAQGADEYRNFWMTTTQNKLSAPKAVDALGMPLNGVVQRDLQQATVNQPGLWTEYGAMYKSYHGAKNSEEKDKLGPALLSKEAKLKANYEKIGQYVANNAGPEERQFIGKVGLGLTAQSVREDFDKLYKLYTDNAADPNDRALAAHLYRGLGFGNPSGFAPPKNSNLFKYQTEDTPDAIGILAE